MYVANIVKYGKVDEANIAKVGIPSCRQQPLRPELKCHDQPPFELDSSTEHSNQRFNSIVF